MSDNTNERFDNLDLAIARASLSDEGSFAGAKVLISRFDFDKDGADEYVVGLNAINNGNYGIPWTVYRLGQNGLESLGHTSFRSEFAVPSDSDIAGSKTSGFLFYRTIDAQTGAIHELTLIGSKIVDNTVKTVSGEQKTGVMRELRASPLPMVEIPIELAYSKYTLMQATATVREAYDKVKAQTFTDSGLSQVQVSHPSRRIQVGTPQSKIPEVTSSYFVPVLVIAILIFLGAIYTYARRRRRNGSG